MGCIVEWIRTDSPTQDEFEMNMRLIGAPTLKDIEPAMVDASNISKHSTLPGESIFNANCEFLSLFRTCCSTKELRRGRFN